MEQKYKTEPVRKDADFSKLSEQSRNELKAAIVGKTQEGKLGGLEEVRARTNSEKTKQEAVFAKFDEFFVREDKNLRREGSNHKPVRTREERVESIRKTFAGTKEMLVAFRNLAEKEGDTEDSATMVIDYNDLKDLVPNMNVKGVRPSEVEGVLSTVGIKPVSPPIANEYVICAGDFPNPQETINTTLGRVRSGIKEADQVLEKVETANKCLSAIAECDAKLAFIRDYTALCKQFSLASSKKAEAEKSLKEYPGRRTKLEGEIWKLTQEVLKQETITELHKARGRKQDELHNLTEQKEKYNRHREAKVNFSNFQPRPVTQEELDKVQAEILDLDEKIAGLKKEAAVQNPVSLLHSANEKLNGMERGEKQTARLLADSQREMARIDGQLKELETFLTNGANKSELNNSSDGGHGSGAAGTSA